MSTIQLYQGLIDATRNIVNQYGKDVLKEERFANILSDLYRDRDNPAIYKIIKSIVLEGISSEMLYTKSNKFQTFLLKSSNTLCKKYGYDKQQTEAIISSLAIGSSIITPTITPTRQKSTTPSPKHPKQKNRANSHSQYKTLYKYLYLSLAFIGLFIAPVLYLLAITGTWWPSCTLFLILIIQAVIFTISYNLLIKHKPLPVIGGCFSAVILCSVIFLAFSPFYAETSSTKEVIHLMGIEYAHDMIFPLVTFAISCYCFGFVNIGGRIAGYDLALIFDHFTNDYFSGDTKIELLLRDKKFMKGFLLSCLFVWFVGAFVMYLPDLDLKRSEVANYFLRSKRNDEIKKLSFAGLRLGSGIDSCVNIVNNSPYAKLIDEDKYVNNYNHNYLYDKLSRHLYYDSILYVRTLWYGDSVDMKLFSLDGKMLAMIIGAYRFPTDSLLNLFSTKYGKPEHERFKDEYLYKTYFEYLETWSWSFKDGIIRIINGNIEYYDRYLDKVAALYKEKQQKQKEEEERAKLIEKQKMQAAQRKRDSLNRIKMLEEERKQEIERKKAIDQI